MQKSIQHLDLFSGIGGFSYALDTIYGKENIHHTFVEYDPFCQAVLKKHWPEAEIHGDIRAFVTDSASRRRRVGTSSNKRTVARDEHSFGDETFLLTGGFPCQPFSQAGRRKGTADDRYLWPPMLECIALYRPRWVIAENVAGLASWSDGLVLETVCADLEKEGYEVCPLVIPAVAVGAPHRRDRIWFVGHAKYDGRNGSENGKSSPSRGNRDTSGAHEVQQPARPNRQGSRASENDANTAVPGLEGRKHGERKKRGRQSDRSGRDTRHPFDQNWLEVATRLCRVDDGIPRRLDRNPRLKALGNAIVPAVAAEIFRAIKEIDV